MTAAIPALEIGQVNEVLLIDDLTRTRIVQYAGASGDYNPLHTDDTYAREVAGYPGVFAHRMLTMGLTGSALAQLVGSDRLASFGVRFKAQVWPGDRLVARFTATARPTANGQSLVDVDITTVNGDGVEVLSGAAVVREDGPTPSAPVAEGV